MLVKVIFTHCPFHFVFSFFVHKCYKQQSLIASLDFSWVTNLTDKSRFLELPNWKTWFSLIDWLKGNFSRTFSSSWFQGIFALYTSTKKISENKNHNSPNSLGWPGLKRHFSASRLEVSVLLGCESMVCSKLESISKNHFELIDRVLCACAFQSSVFNKY